MWTTSVAPAEPLTVTDMAGRTVHVPAEPKRIISIGPGALRLIVYLDAQDKVAGVVEYIEGVRSDLDRRTAGISTERIFSYPGSLLAPSDRSGAAQVEKSPSHGMQRPSPAGYFCHLQPGPAQSGAGIRGAVGGQNKECAPGQRIRSGGRQPHHRCEAPFQKLPSGGESQHGIQAEYGGRDHGLPQMPDLAIFLLKALTKNTSRI